MTLLSAVPLNSITWSVGTLACIALSYRSFKQYRGSANELSKYLGWFGLVMGFAQLWLAMPSFFTLDISTLRATYIVGEFFVYASAIPQAAIVWCLLLRPVMSLRAATIPVAIIGLASWLYAVPRSHLQLNYNFITYKDPTLSTIIIGIMLIGLFLPVGVYFLKAATLQTKLKGTLTSVILGLVYIGVGLFTGGVELVAGEVLTHYSAIGDLVFFGILVIVMLWPRRVKPLSGVPTRT